MRLQSLDYSTEANQVYFVTVHADSGNPFVSPDLADDLTGVLHYQRESGRLLVHAYAIMPNHVHLVVSLCRNGDCLANVMKDFKSFVTRQSWRRGHVGTLWQRGYYEHVCRDEKDALTKCNYVLSNPVRAGLALALGEWPYAGVMDDLPI